VTKALVLLNESAGTLAASREGDEPARIRAGFAAHGVDALVRSVSPDDLERVSREAAEDATVAAVVVGGGDGTLNTIAAALAGTGKPFGVLPLGTHNHFAKDMAVPLDLDAAVAALARGVARGRYRDVDVGEVNGRPFLNFSGIGLHPLVVKHRDVQRAVLGRRKFVALFVALLRVLRRPPVLRARLETPAFAVTRITPSVIVCNNPHQMRVFGVDNVSHADRSILNVYVARSTNWAGLVWLIVRAAFRTLDSARKFEAFTLADVTIHTRRRSARVSIDGEVTDLPTPLAYRVRRGGLRVVEPVVE
jgi:diacylglycerol kinase family enzyme